MARLCERPGCSESGAVAYGMVPEHLLFWISPMADAPVDDPGVLCGRHADAMVVPRGWTLDDRREGALRLFKPRPVPAPPQTPIRRSRRRVSDEPRPEQLVIDGTGEIPRPAAAVGLIEPDEIVATDKIDEIDVEDIDLPAASLVDDPALDAPAEPAALDESLADLDNDAIDDVEKDAIQAPVEPAVSDEPAAPWTPAFDHDDDLNGLLEVRTPLRTPLLARAFRGTGRSSR